MCVVVCLHVLVGRGRHESSDAIATHSHNFTSIIACPHSANTSDVFHASTVLGGCLIDFNGFFDHGLGLRHLGLAAVDVLFFEK